MIIKIKKLEEGELFPFFYYSADGGDCNDRKE